MPTDEPVQYALTRRPLIGGVPLVGTNSLPSIRKRSTTDKPGKRKSLQPVQTTESPSEVDRKEIPSTAPMTGGSGQTTKEAPSDKSTKDTPKRTPVKKVVAKKVQPDKKSPSVRTVGDELDDDEDF